MKSLIPTNKKHYVFNFINQFPRPLFQTVASLTVLLVYLIIENAHAGVQELGWENNHLRIEGDVLSQNSVVENWQSVCKDLCG